jgi:hypothetical protein
LTGKNAQIKLWTLDRMPSGGLGAVVMRSFSVAAKDCCTGE